DRTTPRAYPPPQKTPSRRAKHSARPTPLALAAWLRGSTAAGAEAQYLAGLATAWDQAPHGAWPHQSDAAAVSPDASSTPPARIRSGRRQPGRASLVVLQC